MHTKSRFETQCSHLVVCADLLSVRLCDGPVPLFELCAAFRLQLLRGMVQHMEDHVLDWDADLKRIQACVTSMRSDQIVR